MKIRFYHWWVYKLYYYFWNPIFMERPSMVKAYIDHAQEWLDKQPRVEN